MIRLPNNTVKRKGYFSYRFSLASLNGFLFGWSDSGTEFLFLMRKNHDGISMNNNLSMANKKCPSKNKMGMAIKDTMISLCKSYFHYLSGSAGKNATNRKTLSNIPVNTCTT